MRNSARKVGVLFLAVMSVYSGPANLAVAAADAGQAARSGSAGSGSDASAGSGSAAGYVRKGAADTKAAAAAASAGTGAEDTLVEAQDAAAANRQRIAQATAAAGVEPSAADPFAPAAPLISGPGEGSSVTADDVNYNNDSGVVEIHVNDANLVEVLRMLSLQSQRNIIASKEVKGTVTANLYGVTVREALDAILKSNGYTYREEGNFVYVYTVAEMQAMDAANRVRKTEVFRLHYVTAGSAAVMLKPVLSEQGEMAFSEPAEVGIGAGGSTGGNGMADQDILVITDYEDRIDEIRRVIKEIDRRPQQILIEATILRATLKENNAMGIDFQVLGGVDFSTLTGAGGNFGSASTSAFVNTNGAAPVTEAGYGAAGTSFTNSVPNGGLQIGIAKNNIAIFLKALESITDTAVVANPKVLVLNKQRGEVFVGNDIGYRTTITNENNTTTEQVEFLKTGTRLVFRPFIGEDGYIRLEVKPEDSSGNLQNGLPFKFTTEVTTNILVRDGHTVVIGGLFREDSNTTRGQVPGLGNLPLVGALFSSQADNTVREEIIVLLTPHIIKDDQAYSQISEDEMARVDQVRVGVRRGMMPWGRERLAEGAYDDAIREMAKPNPDLSRALWHLNIATNLNPKFIEAITLKQQLTGRRVTSVDTSLTRGFVRRVMMQDLDRRPPAVPAPVAPAPTAAQPQAPAVRPVASAHDMLDVLAAMDAACVGGAVRCGYIAAEGMALQRWQEQTAPLADTRDETPE